MFQNLLHGRRHPVVHYGVLAIIIALLFFLGYQAGQIIINSRAQTVVPDTIAAPMANGAALIQPPRLVTDFTLTDQHGQSISMSDLRGKPVLLFFGYTHCPDECPTTLANLAQVHQKLGAQADAVQVVFISVDPQRDTPQVMADYLANFDDSFIGMTGDVATLQQAGKQFGLAMDKVILGPDGTPQPAPDASENYFMTHTSPTFVIDSSGKLSQLFFYGTDSSVIAGNMRQVLASEAS